MGKTKNPLEITMVFGTEAVDALYDSGITKARRYAKNGDGMIVKKKFNTQQEMDAYLAGINDMDGWYKYAVIDSDGKF